MKAIAPARNFGGYLLLGLAVCLNVNHAAADVVAVVSAANTATALSKNLVVDIFLGKANRFPDGGLATPVDQTEGSAMRDEFYDRFAGKSPAQIKAHWSKVIFTGRGEPPADLATCAEVKKFIIEHPDAIGYIERRMVDEKVRIVLPP
jgi:ABC-type phosphate transport system substrate-binding protein